MEFALSPETPMALALGLELFMVMWVAMMIAMMFPSVYPMVLLLACISRRPAGLSAESRLPTCIVVAGYLVIWTLIGGVMYLLSLLVHWAHGQSTALTNGLVWSAPSS
jgi:predicted metal-binding membrane protein